MDRGLGRLLVPLTIVCGLATAAEGEEASFDRDIRPVLETYCFECHGEERQRGGIDLASFDTASPIKEDPDLWELVLDQLHGGGMPPSGKPRPTADELERLVRWIDGALDVLATGASEGGRDPGRSPIRRLNRTEYNNTLRDLLGIEGRPADAFPADGSGGEGFDNNAETLFVPPVLLERYLDAATRALEEADSKLWLVATPDAQTLPRESARQVLTRFARRAFRRPPRDDDVDRLLALFDRASSRGETFEEALKLPLRAMLVSPHFLFRVEESPTGDGPVPVSDTELAVRLSYFLWCSMPDDELDRLADEGRLGDSKALDGQVERMLRDPKARSFCESFVTQWLGLRPLLETVRPDAVRFPDYTDSLRDAMLDEPVEVFLHLLHENGSLLDLLSAEYILVNDELAAHYGIEGVTGAEPRRVSLSDSSRGGVLTMAGVLTVTSYPLRTSPVLRGKWVLEQLLGAPPPPPPANVPPLPEDEKALGGLTLRERLEQHRKDPTCASCHSRMDPIGFGLENFDPTGRWRVTQAGKPIDASGELPDGSRFHGPIELRRALLSRKDEFVRNLTEKMLAFALGRGLERSDRATIKEIVAAVKNDEYRVRTLVAGVVQSFPFRYRRSASRP